MSWQPIMTAPLDGTRVRVGHELDPNSMKVDSIFKTTGAFDDEAQEWKCSSGFVCVDRYLRWQPTHWLPEQSHD